MKSLGLKHAELEEMMPVLLSVRHEDVGKFRSVFISPDRSPEEQAAQRTLVAELKKKKEELPGQRHYIRGGKVCSSEQH